MSPSGALHGARAEFIGFRKIDAYTGSWVARMRNETGHKVYNALGYVSAVLDYDAGVLNVETTVLKACEASLNAGAQTQ